MNLIENTDARGDKSRLKTYIAPQLRVFGEVSALTAAGSKNKAEGTPVGSSGKTGGNLP